MRCLASAALCALILGITSRADARQVDPTAVAAREAEFLRAAADLGLERALTDLELVDPASSSKDPATERLRFIANARLQVRSHGSTTESRQRAIEQLRAARTALITALATDPRVPLWLGDAAEDEIVLAFFGLAGGPQAIAGSPVTGVVQRASEPLKHALAVIAESTAAATQAPAAGTELSHQLSDDAAGRRPLLGAIARALELAIDRGPHDAQAAESRSLEARQLVELIRTLRDRVPHRLKVEADIGEAAAAAVAPNSESARFAAARLALAGDPVAFTLARILAVDALVSERRGQEAMQALAPILNAKGMPTSLAIIAADASARTRIALGKSATSDSTLGPWIAALKEAPQPEREPLRIAVLDRIGGVLLDAHVEGPLSPIATVALLRAKAFAGEHDAAGLAALAAIGADVRDAEAQACALGSIAEIHLKQHEWALAANAFAEFARRLPNDPASRRAMQLAVDLELVLDSSAPRAREHSLETTLLLALSHYPELPSRPRTAAHLAAVAGRRSAAQVAAAPATGTREAHMSLAGQAKHIRDLARAANEASVDPGPLTDASLHAVEAAADIIAPDRALATLAAGYPAPAQWTAWPRAMALLVAQLRLERLAKWAPVDPTLDNELTEIPSSLDQGLDEFLAVRLGLATASSSDALPRDASEHARRALVIADRWRRTHPREENQGTIAARQRLLCQLALASDDGDRAAREARTLMASTDDVARDRPMLVEALRAALPLSAEGQSADHLTLELMEVARELERESPRGSPTWWLAQLVQLEVATRSGRGGEPVMAKLARLRAFDESLGGPDYKQALESMALESTPSRAR